MQNPTITEKKPGFMRQIMQRLQMRRVGDLLVEDGTISVEQLELALEQQQNSRKQLGRILLEQHAVSATRLYRKLFEQWCMRVMITGVTFFVSAASMSPNNARAAQAQGDITAISAMAFNSFAKKDLKYPRLFGTKEVRSNNVTPFHKWTGMIKKFEAQLFAHNSSPHVMMWKAEIARATNADLDDQIRMVNDFVNNQRYITDDRNWQQSDYWATPIEFFSRGGDCEDFAIAKYASLRALGVPHENMRIAIVDDLQKGIKHAILVVYTEKGTYILDNQDKRTRLLEKVSRYKPIFSINKSSWWLHRA